MGEGRSKIQVDPTRYCLLEGRSVQLIPKCDHSAPVSRRNRQFLNHRHDHCYNNDDDDDDDDEMIQKCSLNQLKLEYLVIDDLYFNVIE